MQMEGVFYLFYSQMLLPLVRAVCDSTEVNNSIFGSYMSKQISYTQQMYVLGDCH